MLNGKRVLGIVPARGGSKRIPRKNIKPLNGRPLISYAIAAGLGCSLVDRVIVSTDDQEIADVARAEGADVPFLRPAELSNDTAGDQPVMLHALDALQREGEAYDIIAWLRPTTPFKMSSDITAALETLEQTHSTIVRSVTVAEGVFHPYWMYRGDGTRLSPLMQINIEDYLRSQSLPKDIFRLNGVIDVMRVEAVRGLGRVYASPDMGYIVIPPERAGDIDEPIDFAWADFLLTNGYVQL